MHLGHKSIINELIKVGTANNLETAILTFWPHPRFVFNPNEDLKLLNTIEEKQQRIEKYGVETLFIKEFDEEFRNLTGEEFVRQILIDKLNVKYLIIGYDHSFGKIKAETLSFFKNFQKNLILRLSRWKPLIFMRITSALQSS